MIVSARTVLITDAPFSNQLYGTRPTRILCMSVPTSYLSAAIIASAIGPAEGGFWPVKRLPAVQTLDWKTPPSLKIPPFSDMRSSHEPGPLGLETTSYLLTAFSSPLAKTIGPWQTAPIGLPAP